MKKKIAVIGGGVGAITSVYALTQTKDWDQKYDITLYQMGWRLGGKGASGRNADAGQRIEEHGLHIWAGFYENAFRNMRACYDQLAELGLRDPDAPLGTMDAAFKPLSHLFLSEEVPVSANSTELGWRPWLVDLPYYPDEIPGTGTTVPTPFEMLERMFEIMIEFLRKGEFKGTLLALLESILTHSRTLPRNPSEHLPSQTSIFTRLITDMQAEIHKLESPENLQVDGVRRLLMLMDISMAYAHGIVASDAFTKGYDVLDQWEFTEWLRANGASEAALNHVLIRGCYDFVFGYAAGDIHMRNVGAGTAARAMGRLILSYKGAIFWKMQAGMGDTIFGPYYQVLKKLGVTFKFFNAARALRLNAEGTSISAIDMVEQAATKGEYDPLVNVQDLPCWPSQPRWDKLVDGDKLKRDGVDFECERTPPVGRPYQLLKGDDFDHVILGASMGSLPYLTQELALASPCWQAMLNNVQTVATEAAQFWLTETAEDLGWDAQVRAHNAARAIPEPPLQTVITGFEEPLDTWADMSHLLPREDWPARDEPKSIAYFCSPAPDGETLENFAAQTRDWADNTLTEFWPGAKKHGGFDSSLLCPADGKAGIDAQYYRVNMYGSERYVLSVKGSVYHRLAPDQSGFDNLTLAGDWTRCGLNAGCVEAATMSGIAAASAVSGEDLLNVGADDIPENDTVEDTAMFQTNSISGAHWPLTPFFARGEMTGWFMFYNMPRAKVEKLIPEGLHLAGQAKATHTVGISLCHYHNVRSSFLPGFTAMSPYGEATFAIPDVQTDEGGRAPFLYPRKLYVNNSMAIFLGRFFYAMNKSKADITVGDTSFAATDSNGLNLRGDFLQHEDPVPLSNHPAHGAISDCLNLSFVTRRNAGKLLYNAFNLELDRAYVAPVSGHVTAVDPSDGGFPATDINVSPLQDHPTAGLPGAFRIWCSWSMTNPFDSKRVRRATKARSFIERVY